MEYDKNNKAVVKSFNKSLKSIFPSTILFN